MPLSQNQINQQHAYTLLKRRVPLWMKAKQTENKAGDNRKHW